MKPEPRTRADVRRQRRSATTLTRALLLTATLILAAQAGSLVVAQEPTAGAVIGEGDAASALRLAPTAHPILPRDVSQLWLAPDPKSAPRSAASASLASAARLVAQSEFAKALDLLSPSTIQQSTLGDYALYYIGRAQLGLTRPADALKTFKALSDRKPTGFLSEAALLGQADARLALDEADKAVEIYERITRGTPSNLEDVLLRLGRAARASGDLDEAYEAFARVYYEFALSDRAPEAGAELATLTPRPLTTGSVRYKLELGRAERLFGSRQYAAAASALEALRPVAAESDREIVQLRLAETDYFLKHYRGAREGLRPFVDRATRQAEAMYFFAIASRELGDQATYLATARAIVDRFPGESWAEEALNNLGSFYLKRDEDDTADAVFRELYQKYPKGRYAERAAWKAGWRAYRDARYGDTIRVFEQAAADFPRSDYRPSWLYWAGRARERAGGTAEAGLRYSVVVADYQNSYYGRLAQARLKKGTAFQSVPIGSASTEAGDIALPAAPPPNAAVITALLSADMYDDALNELRFARRMWGPSAVIDATVAWTNQQQARTESGTRRFQLLRGAINTMRRTYPQFMTAGGEDLPRPVLTVIFPIAYWDLIRRYSAANRLDPYLVAALVAQESTFVADIRSSANAYGLMQLLPSTARQNARKLKVPYSARLITDPETNIRIGTAYFAEKIQEFGGVHLALAAYNAGERAVRQWVSERSSVEREEFIDDIPYPETQNYVKRILGTADDYRRLYGDGVERGDTLDRVSPVQSDRGAIRDAAPAKKGTPAQKKKPSPKTRKR